EGRVLEESLESSEGEQPVEDRLRHRLLLRSGEDGLAGGERAAGVTLEGVVDELLAEQLLVERPERRLTSRGGGLGSGGEFLGHLGPQAGHQVVGHGRLPVIDRAVAATRIGSAGAGGMRGAGGSAGMVGLLGSREASPSAMLRALRTSAERAPHHELTPPGEKRLCAPLASSGTTPATWQPSVSATSAGG